jgi:hypothetical protein
VTCRRHQLRQQRLHGLRAHEPGLGASARAQQAIGEHVPAFVVRGQLHLVHGHEVHVAAQRHCFGGAHPVVGPARNALLFSRDQRHAVFAHARAHSIVNFARQQPQRQADHPAFVLEHPLDRAMGLAGVRRSQQRDALSGIRRRHRASMPRRAAPCQQRRALAASKAR